MKPRFRHDMDRNYMVLQAPESLQGNEYQVRMLLANDIPGCLKARIRMIDNKIEFFYDITSKQPMGRIYEKKRMGSRDIRALVEGLYRAFESAAVFLLDGKSFLLDPGLIYMDVESRELYLCYLPSSQGDGEDAFRKLTEYILKRLDHRDDQAVLWGYALYSKTEVENYSAREALRETLRQTWDSGKEAVGKGPESMTGGRSGEPKGQHGAESLGQPGEGRHGAESLGQPGEGRHGAESLSQPGEGQRGAESLGKPMGRHKGKRIGKQGERRSRRKSQREKTNKGRVETKNRSRRVGIAVIGILIIGGIAALGLLEVLSLTQTGGLLFLAICVSVYLFINDEKQEEQQAKQSRSFIKEEKREEQNTIGGKRESRAAKSKIIPEDPIEAEEPYELYEQAEEAVWDTGERPGEKAAVWDASDRPGAEETVWDASDRPGAEEAVRHAVERTEADREILVREQGQDGTLPSGETKGDASQDDAGTAYGQTTVLQEGSYGVFPVLISIHPEIRENIVVDRELLVIGKLKGQADILLNLPAVSRIHAKLERRPEGCFLTDLNSTNGTFVNGERLQADECRQVHTGDEIFFAGAGYYMKI